MSGNTKFHHRKGLPSPLNRERALHMEALEERTLLSVSPLDTDAADVVPAVVAQAEALETPALENVVLGIGPGWNRRGLKPRRWRLRMRLRRWRFRR